MNEIYTLNENELPFLLKQINDKPKLLYVKGQMPKVDAKVLCVVGSRRHSSYGEEACKKLIAGLKGENICIVSGLAVGIDGIAHRAALEAGLQTIAFPGSGLDPNVLYPARHARLAEEILHAGGALISEFNMTQIGTDWTFPRRNRLMAGISDATLIIEGAMGSGTLITSRLALSYNRDVGAVPGQITSKLSEGPNDLIQDGAKCIRNSNDILEMLGLRIKDQPERIIQPNLLLGLTENERVVIELLRIESMTAEIITMKSGLSAREVNEAISSLEISGFIKQKFANSFTLV